MHPARHRLHGYSLEIHRLLLVLGLLWCAPVEARSKDISFTMKVAVEWHPQRGARPGTFAAAVGIRRALDAKGRPHDPSMKAVGCDPADLRREFRLPKTDYLLGEPIVVEAHVSLNGPGRWR